MSSSWKYNKGSIWRKWDLHAHTPLDAEWVSKPLLNSSEEKESFAKHYIDFARKEDLSVIAITDHNFCNSLEECLIPFIQKEATKHDITIMPGFEIAAKDGSGIHILCIFPENTKLNHIKSIVDQCFPPNTDLIPTNNRHIPVSSKSINEIHSIIETANQEAILVFAHADRENGVLDGGTITGARRVQEWTNQHVNIAQISKNPKEYTTGFMHNVINLKDLNYSREITFINASDCRLITKEEKKDGRFHLGEKYVWIKADPTFEGLKQIIYEPKLRVAYSDIPDEKSSYQVIDRIEINNEIIHNKLVELNPYLNSIIGGRSTGKSILLASIANKLKTETPIQFGEAKQGYDDLIRDISATLEIYWKDGIIDDTREVEFFKQGYMYSIARNETEKNDLIQKILKTKGKESHLSTYKKNVAENKKIISDLLSDFFKIKAEISEKKQTVSDKGDLKGITDEITRLEAELSKINTSQITEDEKLAYSELKEKIELNTQKKTDVQNDINSINDLKNLNILKENISYELTALTEDNKKKIQEIFTDITKEFKSKWLERLNSQISQLQIEIIKIEKDLKADYENPIYKKVSKAFQESTKLSELDERINKEKEKSKK